MKYKSIEIKNTSGTDYASFEVPSSWKINIYQGVCGYSGNKQGFTLLARFTNHDELNTIHQELAETQSLGDPYRACKVICSDHRMNSYRDWQHEYHAHENAPSNFPAVLFCWARTWMLCDTGFVLECAENASQFNLAVDWSRIYTSVNFRRVAGVGAEHSGAEPPDRPP
jgi:hypothetical protein